MIWIRRILTDLRQGKNWEYFVTIPAALIIGILSLLGIGQTYIAALTLAVLALLAGGMLGSRRQVEELADKMEKTVGGVFLDKFPASLDQDFAAGSQVWMVGVTLSTPLSNPYYPMLQKKVRQGHTLYVLMLAPDSPAVEMAETRAYARADAQRTNRTISDHLGDFCALRTQAPGRVHIRTIAHPLGHGLVAVDPDTPNGALNVSNYPFKTEGGALPKFVLRPKDGMWYSLYREELQHLWDAGQDWPCVEPAHDAAR